MQQVHLIYKEYFITSKASIDLRLKEISDHYEMLSTQHSTR